MRRLLLLLPLLLALILPAFSQSAQHQALVGTHSTAGGGGGSTPLVQNVFNTAYGTGAGTYVVTSGTNLFLIVWIEIDGVQDITACTAGGVAMTQVAEVNPGTAGGGSFGRTEIWRLVNPALTAGDDIIPTFASGAPNRIYGAVVLTNVHQTTPLGTAATANGNNDDMTVSVTANAADLTIGGGSISLNASETWTATQTSRWNNFVAASLRGVGESAVGATTIGAANNLSAALEWSIAAVAIKGA